MAKFEINWLEDKSDEGVLKEIRRVAALVPDRQLTKKAFNSHSKIHSATVERRFGSWSEATRRAGLTDALPVYSDAAIIEDLNRVFESSQNEPFTSVFYSHHGQYSLKYVKQRFGGWQKALEAAGIGNQFRGPPITDRMRSQPGRTMSDEEILAGIRGVSRQLGRSSLSGADIEANSEIRQDLLYRRFGGIPAALKKAGVEPVPHGRRHTEDEVFENLLNVWTHYGRPPTISEMDHPPSKIGRDTYLHRYEGWRKALKAFIERANSEVDSSLDLPPEHEPSTPAECTGPTESAAVSTAGTESSQSARRSSARSSGTRVTPTNVQPEDRRAPGYRLRYRVLDRDHFKCVLCGDNPARNPECGLQVDHIVPWSKGGRTREDNLRTLCATCNIGRGNSFAD